MKTYRKAKCYDKNGFQTATGVVVVITSDVVQIGRSSYPIADVEINLQARTITSKNGWHVTY